MKDEKIRTTVVLSMKDYRRVVAIRKHLELMSDTAAFREAIRRLHAQLHEVAK